MATRAYVDGFNLYRSLLHNKPRLKWLDFTALWPQMFPDLVVERTYYFTAKVGALPLDRGAPARQERYLSALRTKWPEIQPIFGKFYADTVVARPTAGAIRDRVEVHRNREKGSDVNLGAYLMHDVYEGEVDTAIVVSNDSDLRQPIEFARAKGATIILCSPTARPSSELAQVVSQHFVLREARTATAQFPDVITTDGGRQIHRPREWS
jgi:uncharacterized LabA/DUF88 family protein